jgi:Mrp family chromosome partitioning ATPase
MEEQTVLQRYLDLLRRRKWVVAIAVLLTPVAAFALSHGQARSYRASADVLLSHQNLAATLTNTTDPQLNQLPDRYAQTQAELAREPAVAERVLAVSRGAVRDAGLKPWSVSQFLAASDATPKQNADLLELRVAAPVPALATQLTNSYANQFAAYRRQLDTAAFRNASSQLAERLTALAQTHQENSPLYAALRGKQEQIRTLEALQTPSQVVRSPVEATRVQPRPIRNAMLGLVLGSLLAIALVMVIEALDTRVRSEDEIAARLGLSLLGRIPKPSRNLREHQRLVTLAAPDSFEADAFRLLRANLELANLKQHAKTIMITSAAPGEGKSTTAANLCVELARSGKRVVLVDLDLRRPLLHRFFGLDERTGLTSVALGDRTLEEALMLVTISKTSGSTEAWLADDDEHAFGQSQDQEPRPVATVSSNGQGDSGEPRKVCALEVLPTGLLPSDPGDFMGTPALKRVLEQLRERADLVIIDAPPFLAGSGGPILSGEVDGIVVVSRLDAARRPALSELRRLLETATAAKLGFVLTGAKRTDGYRYGYGSSSESETRAARGSRSRYPLRAASAGKVESAAAEGPESPSRQMYGRMSWWARTTIRRL